VKETEGREEEWEEGGKEEDVELHFEWAEEEEERGTWMPKQ